MPVVISGIGPSTPVLVAVSPLAELGSALHVPQDPGHHDRTGWAAGVRAGMSPRQRALTDRWSWTVQKHRSTPFVTVHGPDEHFDVQRERLRESALAARVRDFTQMAAVNGTRQAVAGLDAGLSVIRDGVSLAEVCHTRHDVSRRGLAVVPSVAWIVGTDPTLANRHLRHLNRSGLTHTTRRGRYVQYRLHTGAVAALGTDTLTLLLK